MSVLRRDHGDIRQLVGQRRSHEVLLRVVWHSCDEELIDREMPDRGGADRVAVRRALGHRVDAHVAGGAGPVLDHERLAKLLGERLRDEPRKDIDRAAGRKADDDAHRAVRVGLRRRAARERGQGGSR